MQKLLQVSLISDLSSSNDHDDDYGQGWASIEGHMKAIICKDNGVSKKKNQKRLVLTLNNSFIKQKNSPSKVSPKPFNTTKSPSINSLNQKIRTKNIFEHSNLLVDTQSKPFQEKKSYEILNKNEPRIIYQEEDSKNLSIQELQSQLEDQQKKENFTNKQQLPPIINDNYSKQKTQPLMKPRKYTVQQLFLPNENINEDFHINIKEIPIKHEKDKQEKNSMFEIEKKIIESDYQTYSEENLFKISKMKILVPINNITTNPQQKLKKKQSRTKSDHNGNSQTQCYKIYRIFQKKSQSKVEKHKTNRNQSIRLSLEQTKKINKLKILILENNIRDFSNKQKKDRLNYHYNSLKSLHRDSIILPLIGRQHNSEKKLQKIITARSKSKKMFSYFKSGNFLQQKSNRHLSKKKTILDLDADKKRIQSIKLIVKKNKQLLGSSSIPKRFFEEIKIQKNQEGRFRKMTMSEFFKKMSIHGEMDLHKDETNRQFERKKYSKSCQQIKKSTHSQAPPIKNLQYQIIKNQLQIKTKANTSPLVIHQNINDPHSISRRSKSKSKGKSDVQQKNSKKQQNIFVRQRNLPVFKIQPDKHRSKLLIIRR